MSVSSYRLNVAKGVTGASTYTCFPAALEQVSPSHRFDPEVYLRYKDTIDLVESFEGQDLRKKNPILRDLYADLAERLGCHYGDILFERLRSIGEFSERVIELLDSSHRVVVDIMTEGCHGGSNGFVHSVGISPVGDICNGLVRLRSTWVPKQLSGVVGLESVYPHLSQLNDPPRKRFEFNDANMSAFPL